MEYFFGIDLGGTNIAAGLVDSSGTVLSQGSVKTNAPRPAEALCDDMTALCLDLARQAGIPPTQVTRAGIGSPGIVWEGVVYSASNLGFDSAPLGQLLSQRLQLPVFVENDANTAAFGEYAAGAGKGCHSLAAVTIGTGIGCGIILNGQIFSGFNGAAAELGHIPLHRGGRPCPCGRLGCMERYCSATGLTITTRAAMEANPNSLMWELCGGDMENAGAKIAFQAMKAGDSAGKAVVDDFIQDLAQGIATVVCLLQPELVCIGGGVAKEGNYLILPLRERVDELTLAGRDGLRTSIVTAGLGNNAGIIGAAMLGRASTNKQ